MDNVEKSVSEVTKAVDEAAKAFFSPLTIILGSVLCITLLIVLGKWINVLLAATCIILGWALHAYFCD